MSLRSAVMLVVAGALLGGVIPAGIVTGRQLERTIEQQSRADLERARMVLEDRWSVGADMRMMHAQELARLPALGAALERGDSGEADRVMGELAAGFGEQPVLISGSGEVVLGVARPPVDLVEATRRGEMPVTIVDDGVGPSVVALAPVIEDGVWVGAAGGETSYDLVEAGTLAGLTRSGVIILGKNRRVAATTVSQPLAAAIVALLASGSGTVGDLAVGRHRYLALETDVAGDASVVFLLDLEEELSVVQGVRRTAVVTILVALALALVVSGLFAGLIARPVSSLAAAADRLASGDHEVTVPGSSLREVDTLANAFGIMRDAIVQRVADLVSANEELELRQQRLTQLQAELVQRERLAATGQLVTQLAHEIRNPIASVRNCLEVLRRLNEGNAEARRFADMAVDELLRMHELAEQMLQVDRPGSAVDPVCDVMPVVREAVGLVDVGDGSGGSAIRVRGCDATAAIGRDALKQVLFNLLLNAREATGSTAGIEVEVEVDLEQEVVRIDVLDRGAGIAADVADRVFDPFFTTKSAVHGVGLGLFITEAVVRTVGGRVSAGNRSDGPGARFQVRLPRRDRQVSS